MRKSVPYQTVASKLQKTRVLLADAAVAGYIPETVVFSAASLESMLQKYGAVFLKPDRGGGGKRAIVVETAGDGYRLRTGTDQHTGLMLAAACAFVERVAAGDDFLVQPAIDGMTVQGRPFGTRVSVQKPYSHWLFTGMLSTVAAPNKIVTNRCSGGSVVPFRWAFLEAGGGPKEAARLERQLQEIGLKVAAVLNEEFAGLRELGLDTGVDRDGRIWLFEVNTMPRYIAFKLLKDQSFYRTIDYYHHLICRTHHQYLPKAGGHPPEGMV